MQAAGAAALIASTLLFAGPSLATLNRFEEAAGGEFGVGTALQYGSAEAIGEKFDGQVHKTRALTAVIPQVLCNATIFVV